jgi:cytochrome c-type biogenesis protein CcmH
LTIPEFSVTTVVAAAIVGSFGLVAIFRLRGRTDVVGAGRRRLAVGAAAAVSVVALGIALFGAYRLNAPATAVAVDSAVSRWAPSASPAAASGGVGRALSQEQLQRMVDQVSETLKTQPDDSASWAMLAHSYEMMGRFPDALKAYEKLSALLPKDADVRADYADVMGVSQGRSLKGEPARLIKEALALDPKNIKALTLAGKEAFERKAYAESIAFWERARKVATDPTYIAQVDVNIAEARALGGLPAPVLAAASAAKPASASSAVASFITGRITVSAALKGQFGPDDALFVFARPAEGSKMPVALMRRKAGELPLDFALDDSMAMVPDFKLSNQTRVIIGARISKQGDARPQAGDLQVLSAPIAVGAKGIRLDISEVVK